MQLTPLEVANALHYTAMTMTRAFDELESLNLGKATRQGKQRQFIFMQDLPLLWAQAEPMMQNPVKKRFFLGLNKKEIKQIKSRGFLAGLSALEELSMLSSPKHLTYGVSLQTWKELQKIGNIEKLPLAEEANIELEVWSYDPRLFAKEDRVDPFSLYLSLKEMHDERVKIALKKLIEKIKW